MTIFKIEFQTVDSFDIEMAAEGDSFATEFDTVIDRLHYDGAYSFTPSSEEQTIETAGLVLSENITIKPIPSNYGLITWNGATLTVS